MLELTPYDSIKQISQSDWDCWFGTDYPFLRWDFLAGLEDSGCTDNKSGWLPCHLVLTEGDEVLAVVPGFLKDHSYGEYVFDWAWADAWHRNGINYYPKLVTAAPFTPASGPRIYLNPNRVDALEKLVSAMREWCEKLKISSWHVLFDDKQLTEALAKLGMHQRLTTQFHWFNRGFKTFDDFLDAFSSRKRKNLKKERARIAEQGLSLETLVGAEIAPEDWQFFHHCYQSTYAKRSGHGGYLTRAFFTDVCPAMGETMVMVIASHAGNRVAAALYFASEKTLFGRYWGCLREYDFLHFEACYYRGIEFCIARGIERFDPGAQGEHKIQRGFEPILTFSNHLVLETGFDDAIARFTAEERAHISQYREQASGLLPFKSTE